MRGFGEEDRGYYPLEAGSTAGYRFIKAFEFIDRCFRKDFPDGTWEFPNGALQASH
jgi:hypothetical protein